MASSERWQQVEQLLDQTLDLAPADRAAFLDRVCAEDPALRAEVERLLLAARAGSGFLGEPAPAYAAPLVNRVAKAEALTPGARLGTYQIERELGHGGMATVYLAQDLKHDRQVALKVLHPELATTLGPERFLREIRLIARLQHPHILPLHDSGGTDGLLWYTMPYVEGESLRQRLSREGELPVAEALRILREVSDALAYAHAHGLIHRDIKPENLLLAGPHAFVADFGVAKAVHAAAGPGDQTATGLALGTPAYMAPEQATSSPQVDSRADLYALGVVAYELLTGVPPFAGRTAQQLLAAHATQTPEPLVSRRPAVPPALGALVMRLLEKRPADRPQTADEVLRELEAVSTPSAGTAPPAAPAVEVAPRGTHRRSYARWAVLVLGLILLALAVLDRGRAARQPVTNDAGKLLVVLPFENMGHPEDEYFVDGLTEEITNRLIGIQGLRVIARSSAREYKRTPKSLEQIGQELGVGYVLQGTVRWEKAGDTASRVRVSPELIRVADRTSLWADGYDAVLAGVFRVQSEIALEVARALDVALQESERRAIEAIPTENLEAYQLYLQAGERLHGGNSQRELRQAVSLYEAAVRLDPRFVQAQAELSRAHSLMYFSYHDLTDTRLALAKRAADEALRLNPQSPDAHLALGYYHYWGRLDYERALREFAIVEAHQPNNSDLLYAIALVRRRQGKWLEAFARLQKAAQLDPRSFDINRVLAETAAVIREFPEAERAIARMIGFHPDQRIGHSYKAALAMGWRGDTAGAARALREGFGRADRLQLLASPPGFTLDRDPALQADFARVSPRDHYADSGGYYVWRALRERRLGDREWERAAWDSARIVLEAKVRANPGVPQFHGRLGKAYAGLGRKRDAIREARKGLELVPKERDAVDHEFQVFELASVYVLVGDFDVAIDQLEYLVTIPSYASANALRVDPEVAPLRGHPRFERLIARMERSPPIVE